MAAYATIMLGLCWNKYTNLLYNDFDLAVHNQSVANIMRGDLSSSILGIPFLGNHMVLILFLIAPLHIVFPSPMLLLAVQTIVLASGAWAVYLLARHEIDERWAFVFSAIYLIYPPLIYMNLYEFHPVALATTFLLYAFYFFRLERHRPFWIFAILASLCQENVPLVIAGFGFYALVIRRRWRWVVPQIVFGLLAFAVITLAIMPRLNDKIQYLALYSQFGSTPGAIVKGMLTHPASTFLFMFSTAKLHFLNQLAAPLGYLSLLNPLALLPAMPVFLQRLLSARPTEAEMIYHYQAELIPFMFASAILGAGFVMRRFTQGIPRTALFSILLFFPIATFLLTVMHPSFARRTNLAGQNTAARNRFIERYLREMPGDAVVAATFEFLPRLSNQSELYSLHHIYDGRYTLSTIPYQAPANISHVVMNTFDSLTFGHTGFYGPTNYTNLQAMLSNSEWEIHGNIEGYIILRRTGAKGQPLSLIRPEKMSEYAITNVVQKTNAPAVLLGFTVSPSKFGEDILDLFWQTAAGKCQDFDLFLRLKDNENIIWQGRLAPGSRVWPPQSWPDHTTVRDRHVIFLQPRKCEITHAEAELYPLQAAQ